MVWIIEKSRFKTEMEVLEISGGGGAGSNKS